MSKNEAKPALALLASVKAIEAGIASIHTIGQTLQSQMHIVACSVLKHLGKNGDVRLLMKLVEAMPDMSRKNSLILWFETFGPVQYDTKNKSFVYIKAQAVKLGDAMAKPFWKFKANEGAPYEPLDMAKYIDQQISKLEKDAKEGKRDHTALINALRSYKAGQMPAAVQ